MNITLIGMPACGKSTIGVLLSRAAGLRMLDVDRVIEREEGLNLAGIIARDGQDGFRAVEERVNASLKAEDSVIAPGGSVIYSQRAMRHLKRISLVVYLRLSRETAIQRLRNPEARGVTMKPGQTVADLYDERSPLYQRYADIVVDCDGLRPREVVERVRRETGV